ncbi:hypothetical protein [Eilatimonas milleporae]|uniref:Lipoprotein n=1 Tax=Eilatimonas milleporae TaxID=911205 RepID=A0A3M0CWS0_9PROT|nr:hypothetical protein [Eilatimonas milleporae]RMB11796.1 hypothetical protein BXY39_0280 [Eilatimonas milleporae]
MTSKSLKSVLLAAGTALALVACGDSSTELQSPGTEGPNPGVPGPGGPGDPGGPGGPGGPSTGECVAGTTEITVGGDRQCQLSGTITSDITLNDDNVYQLSGAVFVGVDVGADGNAADGDPAVLTIEPGVTIYGATESDILVISRGSQIVAEGSVNNPITFTSAFDLGVADELGLTRQRQAYSGPVLEEPFTSEWGGLVINGRAVVNNCGDAQPICTNEGEGDSGEYGGDDDTDNSGVLRYVVVKYAGNPLTADDELNGVAFQGVGSGTEVDFLHVHNGADDGIEFFGGTVDAKHIIVTGSDDDSIDWTFGWRGKIQYAIVIQNPNQPNGDRGIEADNFEFGFDFAPRSAPDISNITLIGAAPTFGDTAIVLRRGTAARLWNVVADQWRDACFDLDDDATFAVSGPSATNRTGDLILQSTLFGCTDAIDDEEGDPFDLNVWYADQPNNVIGSTSLSNRFINGSAEGAVTATDPSTVDPFFDSVDFIGAVRSADPSDNWTLGWSFGLNPTPSCPSGTTDNGSGGCILEGTITEDVRLVAGLDYFLRGPVFIGRDMGPDPENPLADGDPAVLTIDAGVEIAGEDPETILVISRGSQIRANGTRNAPVVLTATNRSTRNFDTDTSLWGGLVINGRAVVNNCGDAQPICTNEGEGDSGEYGGNDDSDDSGQLFFVRVEFAGNPITADDELNGVAFQGVGSGTEVDYLQVHNGADDGVEFFGGSVNARHVVVTGSDDDSVDWTFGWRGKLQYVLVIQNPNQPNGDRGIEADNFEFGFDFQPRSAPDITNITLIGADPTFGDTAIVLRRGTAARLWNVVATSWRDACFDLDDDATFAVSGTSATDLTGDLILQSTLFDCTDAIDDEEGDPFDLNAWYAGQPNNVIGTNSLTANGRFAYISGTNEAAVTSTDPTAVDSFFENAGFIGAVGPDDNWTAGWTVWIDGNNR